MSLVYFILVSFGLTSILVQSKLFEKFRPKHYFFHCPQCAGFWVGAFLCSINQFTTLFSFDVSVMNMPRVFIFGHIFYFMFFIRRRWNKSRKEVDHVDAKMETSTS